MYMKYIYKFGAYVLSAVFVGGLCLFVYAESQQVLRQSLNDPQIQIAEDVAAMLEAGAPPLQLSSSQISIADSLAPYVIIYDASFQPITSNANLYGQVPKPPDGVFNYAKKHGRNIISWEPKDDIRSAIVVVSVKNGEQYVLAGRSMREVEKREERGLKMAVVAGAFLLAMSWGVIYLLRRP